MVADAEAVAYLLGVYAERHLHGSIKRILEGSVAVELEDAKVDVRAVEGSREHGEAEGDALVPLAVHVTLRHRPLHTRRRRVPRCCLSATVWPSWHSMQPC